MTKLQIVIPLYPDVTHLDFTGPHQVLSRAPSAEVVVASMGGADVAAEGLVFTRLADLAAIERCDILCVPAASAPPTPCWTRPSCVRSDGSAPARPI